jgi:hypothetical protein
MKHFLGWAFHYETHFFGIFFFARQRRISTSARETRTTGIRR